MIYIAEPLSFTPSCGMVSPWPEPLGPVMRSQSAATSASIYSRVPSSPVRCMMSWPHPTACGLVTKCANSAPIYSRALPLRPASLAQCFMTVQLVVSTSPHAFFLGSFTVGHEAKSSIFLSVPSPGTPVPPRFPSHSRCGPLFFPLRTPLPSD